ncbi:extracellular solute-binding protein [Bosea sp. (in: a-proteobacteria)]|uniref:extracellular solute-binding protein n=1 Tax=Bosea sp. (in: a-proteobacteria) TaxID=1871050 RepID=UPI00262E2913|nr:extracellular solute-binding protein [Bosea sp. (in: a-proteobacteria)]MCO5092174.1 extracellular solute-binding protein [Bosea sp. (in: a-proteobacteria)]
MVLSLVAGFGAAAPMAAHAQDLKGRQLNVVSWGGAWTEASRKNFFEPFEKQTGVKINIIPATGDFDAMVRLQTNQGALQIDLLDGGTASLLRKDGLLEAFPPELMASLKKESREGTVFEDLVSYGGTAGAIACNRDMVAKCPTNAAEFWNVKDFPGSRSILGSWSYPLQFAALAAGADRKNLFPIDIKKAVAKLEEIRPHIKVWPESGAQQEQVLVDREVAISYIWNGRAHVVRRDVLPNLQIFWESAVLGVDGGWLVPKGAPNKDVAFIFLDWFGRQHAGQAAWTTALTYPTPSKELASRIAPEIANSLPVGKDVVIISGPLQAQQSKDMRAAWQKFITNR